MVRTIREFLSDSDRAPTILIEVSVGLMAIGLLAAIAAVYFMK